MMPLNATRRDRAINLIARNHTKRLTQYDICKLHVMTDVFHVLDYGTPAFGGTIEAWDYGPVVRHTFVSVKRWATALAFAVSPDIARPNFPLHVAGTNPAGNVFEFVPSPAFVVATDEFSPTVQCAINEAVRVVLNDFADFKQSQRYFHGEIPSAVGYAWKLARANHIPCLNWFDILDGAEICEGRSVELARAHAELWV